MCAVFGEVWHTGTQTSYAFFHFMHEYIKISRELF
jgi:hypothetical protein